MQRGAPSSSVDDDDRYCRMRARRHSNASASPRPVPGRVTVNLPEAAVAVPEIAADADAEAAPRRSSATSTHNATCCSLSARACARQRPHQPGNVGTGKWRDEQFSTICKVAVDHAKPVRIGVNGGSLNQSSS
jgi:(E)-4-hydroxy-3-methylbut-2-enyl-diphosphate synthase